MRVRNGSSPSTLQPAGVMAELLYLHLMRRLGSLYPRDFLVTSLEASNAANYAVAARSRAGPPAPALTTAPQKILGLGSKRLVLRTMHQNPPHQGTPRTRPDGDLTLPWPMKYYCGLWGTAKLWRGSGGTASICMKRSCTMLHSHATLVPLLSIAGTWPG